MVLKLFVGHAVLLWLAVLGLLFRDGVSWFLAYVIVAYVGNGDALFWSS